MTGDAGSDSRRARHRWFSAYIGVMVMVTCDFCGRRADESETLAWTTSVESKRLKRYCVACSREHLRSMEGKLDVEFW